MVSFDFLVTSRSFRFRRHIGALLLIILVTGCGFKLRGSYKLPLEFQYLVIEYHDNQEHPFYLKLRQQLENMGSRVITLQQLKPLKISDPKVKILDLSIPSLVETTNSYDLKGQVAGDRIVASCGYKLLDLDGTVLKEKLITRAYTYSLDPNKLLANASERQSIIEKLNTEIIEELINQLVFFK